MFPNALVSRTGDVVRITRSARMVWMAAASACVGALTATPASAQPTVAVSARALGPSAPTATPIGGLATKSVVTTPTSAAGVHRRLGLPQSVLLTVADAPRVHSGVMTSDNSADDARTPAVRWVATGDRPRWRRDSSVTPVDAWRDLIVSDVVCNGAGVCRERQQRLRARWISPCGCYAFADAWNRIWRVE